MDEIDPDQIPTIIVGIVEEVAECALSGLLAGAVIITLAKDGRWSYRAVGSMPMFSTIGLVEAVKAKMIADLPS